MLKLVKATATCSFCKKVKTDKRIQGSHYGGRSCCKDCFEKLKKEEDNQEQEMSEADYQTWGSIESNLRKVEAKIL